MMFGVSFVQVMLIYAAITNCMAQSNNSKSPNEVNSFVEKNQCVETEVISSVINVKPNNSPHLPFNRDHNLIHSNPYVWDCHDCADTNTHRYSVMTKYNELKLNIMINIKSMMDNNSSGQTSTTLDHPDSDRAEYEKQSYLTDSTWRVYIIPVSSAVILLSVLIGCHIYYQLVVLELKKEVRSLQSRCEAVLSLPHTPERQRSGFVTPSKTNESIDHELRSGKHYH